MGGIQHDSGEFSAGPSLATSPGGDLLYAAWKGEHGDPRLFYSVFDGTGWSDQATLGGNSDAGPALAFDANGTLFAVWKGEWGDLRLFYSSLEGGGWQPQQQIPGVLSCAAPSLTLFGGLLYAVWRGPLWDQGTYFATFDGTDWSGSAPGSAYGEIPSITSSTGPSIAVLNGELYAMFCGIGDDPRMWYTTSQDGVNWQGGTYIPDLVTSDGPTVATFDDQVFAVWKNATDQTIQCASFDGAHWTAQPSLPGLTGDDLSIPPATGLGSSSNYLMTSDCNPILDLVVTIDITEDLTSDSGFSIQLNAYPASGESNTWQQILLRRAS